SISISNDPVACALSRATLPELSPCRTIHSLSGQPFSKGNSIATSNAKYLVRFLDDRSRIFREIIGVMSSPPLNIFADAAVWNLEHSTMF
ncbi:MAG: hypothetical protein JWR73_858, partial [Tardiphaga sp.]|nr:hypothetical protein [Tardiphaga sp.]